MATTPIIQTNGSISGLGTAGEGRNDLDAGENITFTDTEATNSGATYAWTLNDKPIGSGTTLVGAGTATPTLVVDVVGSYRVTATVNGTFSATIVIAVPLPNTGLRIPGFNETTQYNAAGNIRGWQQAHHQLFLVVDAVIGGVDQKVKVSATDTTSDFLFQKVVAGTNVTLTLINGGGNEDLQIAAADPTVKITASDTTAARLQAKIVAGTGITTTVLSPGANETLQISATGGSSGVWAIPEIWYQLDVPANQLALAASCSLSQIHDNWQMIRAGSVVGMNVRVNNALTAGTLTARLLINGVAQTLVLILGAGQSTGRITQAAGVDNFIAGDLISATIATNAAFAAGTGPDVEVWFDAQV